MKQVIVKDEIGSHLSYDTTTDKLNVTGFVSSGSLGSDFKLTLTNDDNTTVTIDLSELKEVEKHTDLASFPATGRESVIYYDQTVGRYYFWNGLSYQPLDNKLKTVTLDGNAKMTFKDENGAEITSVTLTTVLNNKYIKRNGDTLNGKYSWTYTDGVNTTTISPSSVSNTAGSKSAELNQSQIKHTDGNSSATLKDGMLTTITNSPDGGTVQSTYGETAVNAGIKLEHNPNIAYPKDTVSMKGGRLYRAKDNTPLGYILDGDADGSGQFKGNDKWERVSGDGYPTALNDQMVRLMMGSSLGLVWQTNMVQNVKNGAGQNPNLVFKNPPQSVNNWRSGTYCTKGNMTTNQEAVMWQDTSGSSWCAYIQQGTTEADAVLNLVDGQKYRYVALIRKGSLPKGVSIGMNISNGTSTKTKKNYINGTDDYQIIYSPSIIKKARQNMSFYIGMNGYGGTMGWHQYFTLGAVAIEQL